MLFLVYATLFSMAGAALISGLSGIEAAALHAAFDARTPRRSVAAFLLVMSIVLCLMGFSQIVPFFIDGTLPPMIEKANTPTVFVFVLDLGVVVPLPVLSAWWLLNNRPWGHVLAGFVLVKSATMGFALLSMTAQRLRSLAVKCIDPLGGGWPNVSMASRPPRYGRLAPAVGRLGCLSCRRQSAVLQSSARPSPGAAQ